MEATSQSESNPLIQGWEDLRWIVRLSIRYHMHRVRFFDGYHNFTNIMGVFFGSATVITIFSNFLSNQWIPAILGLIVTLFFTIDLIVGSSKRARLHNDLARRFFDLEAEMELLGNPTEESLRQFRAKKLSIDKDEPCSLKALIDVCHNEMILHMGYDKKELIPIPWVQRKLAHIFSFEPFFGKPTPPHAPTTNDHP